jgi:hypothetical protein
MKFWSLTFTGIWPVGAVAVVITEDTETASDAEKKFRQLWTDAHPKLDPDPIDVIEIPCEAGTVRILLDVEY